MLERELLSFELLVESLTEEQLLFLCSVFQSDINYSVESLVHFMVEKLKQIPQDQIEGISQRSILMFTKKHYH